MTDDRDLGDQQEEVERAQLPDEDGAVVHAGRTQGSPPLGPEVLAEDDDLPRQPSPPLDPYTPEPGPRSGEQRAFAVMRWAWVPIIVLVAILVWVAIR